MQQLQLKPNGNRHRPCKACDGYGVVPSCERSYNDPHMVTPPEVECNDCHGTGIEDGEEPQPDPVTGQVFEGDQDA